MSKGPSSTTPTAGGGGGGGMKYTVRNDGSIKFLTGSKTSTPPLLGAGASSAGGRLAPLSPTPTAKYLLTHSTGNGVSRSLIREHTLEVLQLKGGYLHPDDSLHATSTTRTISGEDSTQLTTTMESPMIPKLKAKGGSPPIALGSSQQQQQHQSHASGVTSILTTSASRAAGTSGQGHQNRTGGRNSPVNHDERFPLAPTPGKDTLLMADDSLRKFANQTGPHQHQLPDARLKLPEGMLRDGRDSVLWLEASLNERLNLVHQDSELSRHDCVAKTQDIFNDIAVELCRQVGAQCVERGRLLAKLWIRYSDLVNCFSEMFVEEQRRHKEEEEKLALALRKTRLDYVHMMQKAEDLVKEQHERHEAILAEQEVREGKLCEEIHSLKEELYRAKVALRSVPTGERRDLKALLMRSLSPSLGQVGIPTPAVAPAIAGIIHAITQNPNPGSEGPPPMAPASASTSPRAGDEELLAKADESDRDSSHQPSASNSPTHKNHPLQALEFQPSTSSLTQSTSIPGASASHQQAGSVSPMQHFSPPPPAEDSVLVAELKQQVRELRLTLIDASREMQNARMQKELTYSRSMQTEDERLFKNPVDASTSPVQELLSMEGYELNEALSSSLPFGASIGGSAGGRISIPASPFAGTRSSKDKGRK